MTSRDACGELIFDVPIKRTNETRLGAFFSPSHCSVWELLSRISHSFVRLMLKLAVERELQFKCLDLAGRE